MKILSWNVNGVQARLEAVNLLVTELQPDIMCFLNQTDLVDTYRYLHPDGRDYTYFFQNKPEYRLLNQGFRIDYCLMSEELLPYLIKSEILIDVTDTSNSPLLIEIEL